MILNKFFGILYFLFVNSKLSKSQNVHHGVNQISENFPQKVENIKLFYIIRKDNLVIGPIPSPFSIFFINQGYFGFDPNNANPGAGAGDGSSSDSDTSSGTGNSKNSGNTENTDSGKSNSQGQDDKSKMRNNPKFPRFSTSPKTPTNGQQNQKPAEPSKDLTPPKMEESQINRPNQAENIQSQPPIQQPEPILDLSSVPDPPIDNSGQIALMMATFLGGLLIGFAPLVVTQLLLNATMILIQIMIIFQPTPSPVETSTIHTLPTPTPNNISSTTMMNMMNMMNGVLGK